MGCSTCRHNQNGPVGSQICAFEPHSLVTPTHAAIRAWTDTPGRNRWTDDGCPQWTDWTAAPVLVDAEELTVQIRRVEAITRLQLERLPRNFRTSIARLGGEVYALVLVADILAAEIKSRR